MDSARETISDTRKAEEEMGTGSAARRPGAILPDAMSIKNG